MGGGKLPISLKLLNEVKEFVKTNDRYGNFRSINYYPSGFCSHLRKVLGVGQMAVGRGEDGKIVSLLTWVLVDEITEINKVTWSLPKEITSGKILYITLCVIKEGSTFDMRSMFYKMGMHKRVDEVMWFHAKKGRLLKRRVR